MLGWGVLAMYVVGNNNYCGVDFITLGSGASKFVAELHSVGETLICCLLHI